MNTNNITVRIEKKEEHREVENLVREAFWNVYRPDVWNIMCLTSLEKIQIL